MADLSLQRLMEDAATWRDLLMRALGEQARVFGPARGYSPLAVALAAVTAWEDQARRGVRDMTGWLQATDAASVALAEARQAREQHGVTGDRARGMATLRNAVEAALTDVLAERSPETSLGDRQRAAAFRTLLLSDDDLLALFPESDD